MSLPGRLNRIRPARQFRLEVEAVEERSLLSTLYGCHNGGVGGQPAFTSIQAAVDAAKPGDTIEVCLGTYRENVFINKTLTLLGAQAGVDPITGLRTNPANESIVTKFAIQGTSHVRIDGFSMNDPDGVPLVDQLNQDDTIANNIVLPGASEGVLLFETQATTLIDNEIEGTIGDGIGVDGTNSTSVDDSLQRNAVVNPGLNGIDLVEANGVVVEGNSLSGSKSAGLNIQQSYNVNALNNLVFANTIGAHIVNSAFNAVQQNTVEFNRFEGIDVVGDQGDVITANTVSGNTTSGVGSAIVLDGVFGGETVENTSVLQNHSHGIEVFGISTGVRVSGNTVENNGGDGIGLNGTSHSLVAGNLASGNAVGIHLVGASFNLILENNVSKNRGDGILIDPTSQGNVVQGNVEFGNVGFDAEDDSTGTGTAGTANTWTHNSEGRDNRGGGLGH